jgi:hypothetical protein
MAGTLCSPASFLFADWSLYPHIYLFIYLFDLFASAFLSQPQCKLFISQLVTSALKMETACFSETLASAYESTRRQNPKHNYLLYVFYFMTPFQ